MKQSRSALPPERSAQSGSHPARRRFLAAAAVAAAVAVAGYYLVHAWRRQEMIAQLQAGLPARPDANRMAPTLAERLGKAEAQARDPRTTLAGVADLGRLYHASGFPHEAETCWRLLQMAEPKEARWCYYLADLHRAASDYDGVAAMLARTTALAPGYAPAWLQLADLQFKTGQIEAAQGSYEKRLALVPADPYARLGLARVALQAGDKKKAREFVESLVKDTPEFSPGHNLYAEMLAADGDTAAANKQRWLGRESTRFREADDPWLDELGAWCFNYEQLCIRGTVEYQTKHGDHGQGYFERAIQMQPANPMAYGLLGGLYLEQNNPGKARDILEDGLKQSAAAKPGVMYFVDLSRAYRELKLPAEAERVARDGLARLGREFELYDALGVALGDAGQHEEAVEALRTAVALNPDDTNSNYNLAVALLAVRQLGEAISALKHSLTAKPTFPSSLAMLAQIEIDSGRWEDAAQYLQPLYESHPEMPQARRLMAYWHLRAGMAAEKQKDLALAETHYREGVSIDRSQPELHVRLGTLFLLQGRFGDAVGPLEEYHRLQPDNPQSSLYLGQAYAAVGRRDEARQVLTAGAAVADRQGNTQTADFCREILRQLQ
ncbi:MAG TPA: tetratricopeptide repeat protein [Lacunisphaera sp.]|nr:tetratricopeptide repeat protein [Lacunisphaera sp.]